jgi:PAS domain S-box-containing protein
MGPTEFVLAVLYMISGLLPLVLASLFFQQRHKPGATGLLILSGGVCLWGLANAGHTFAYTETLAYGIWNVRLVATSITVVGWFLAVAEYAGLVRPRPRVVAALLTLPAVAQLLAWTNARHHLHYGADTTHTAVESIVANYGPVFYANATFQYALVGIGAVLLLVEIVDSGQLRRRQSLALLVSALPAAAGNVLHLAVVPSVDLTSFGFVIGVFIIGWALFYGKLLDVVPVARDNLVRNMTDPVVTLDGENRVVDSNPAARDLCGIEGNYVGTHGEEFFGRFPDLVERFGDVMETATEISLSVDGEQRHFDLRITPVYDERSDESARLIVFRDITERKRREQALEQKNERLDQFTSFVSHDLRNPLQVAAGHAALARENGDSQRIRHVESALSRMDEMIEDLRTLTFADRERLETTRVDLKTAAQDAWSGIDSSGLTLLVRESCPVVADREFLLHVLENLFRNAMEHAGENATISVGCLEGGEGFYVADDGPGIPEDEREEVLGYGYTTTDEGTGIGLSIVRTVADAHEWEITVTESESGGARFEFTGTGSPSQGEVSAVEKQPT